LRGVQLERGQVGCYWLELASIRCVGWCWCWWCGRALVGLDVYEWRLVNAALAGWDRLVLGHAPGRLVSHGGDQSCADTATVLRQLERHLTSSHRRQSVNGWMNEYISLFRHLGSTKHTEEQTDITKHTRMHKP